MSSGFHRRGRDRSDLRAACREFAGALLGIIVVCSVLAIGSVHVTVLLVVASAATVCATLSILGGGEVGTSPFAWLALGLIGLTLLQAIPLPWSLLAVVAPQNAEVWSGARELLSDKPTAPAPLSLDPGATLVEALKLWTYFCVLVAAANAASRRGATWGALLLCGSALLLALCTLGHGVLDATKVFGVYTPRLGGQGFRVAPLINPNNLAGYLNLGVAAGMALLATNRPPIPRWITALALTPIVGMCLLTGSRAGLMGLCVNIALGLYLLWPRRHEDAERRALFAQFAKAGGLVLGVATLFAVAASGSRLWHLLFEDNLAKLDLARASVPLIAQHPWLGIGRGAFESVFPALHAASDNSIYSHPENFVVQWAAEWGIPATVLVLGTIAFFVRRGALAFESSSTRKALFAGVCAVTLQNLFDLGFEVPGLMIGIALAIGFAINARSPRKRGGRKDGRPTQWRQPAVAGLVLAAGAALSLLVLVSGRATLTSDRDRVRLAIPSDGKDTAGRAAFDELASAAIRRHPAEPYFPRIAALVAWRSNQNPLPWLNRALERGLSAGRTHYLLGAFLATQGPRQQALLELRTAAVLDPALLRRVASVVVKVTTSVEELVRAAPTGEAGVPFLLAVAGEFPRTSEAPAVGLIEEAIRRKPVDTKVRLSLIGRLLAALGRENSFCSAGARADCVTKVETHLAWLERQRPIPPEVALLRSRFQIATGQAAAAALSLEASCPRAGDRAGCLSIWLEAVSAARDDAALTRVARALHEDCGGEKACTNLLWRSGEAALAIANNELALTQFERAAAHGNSASRWRAVARHAQRIGYYGRALRAIERALILSPEDSSLAREHDAMRQKALSAFP